MEQLPAAGNHTCAGAWMPAPGAARCVQPHRFRVEGGFIFIIQCCFHILHQSSGTKYRSNAEKIWWRMLILWRRVAMGYVCVITVESACDLRVIMINIVSHVLTFRQYITLRYHSLGCVYHTGSLNTCPQSMGLFGWSLPLRNCPAGCSSGTGIQWAVK